ncbi:MAG: response regulator transcription factor [Ignavibacteriae bacterium]|nr:response regulator transcription factor [Ignavibacteriota bacterium]
MDKRITIVIADDHPMFRAGVRQAIESDESLHLIGEAGTGAEALRLIRDRMPQVALLDMRMPEMTGLAVAKELLKSNSTVEIMFLTMHDEEEWFEKAMEVGVKGYLLKDSLPSDILQGIHAVAKGRYYISPKLSGAMMQRKQESKSLTEEFPDIEKLTEMERTVLRLVGESKSSKEIADELFISSRTVDNHRFHIAEKLGIKGRYKLLRFAMENRKML